MENLYFQNFPSSMRQIILLTHYDPKKGKNIQHRTAKFSLSKSSPVWTKNWGSKHHRITGT